jgi:hypothetical protein
MTMGWEFQARRKEREARRDGVSSHAGMERSLGSHRLSVVICLSSFQLISTLRLIICIK